LRYSWLQPRCSLGRRLSGMLRRIGCLLATDMLSRNVGSHLPTYAGNVINEQRPWIFSFIHSLGCLTTGIRPLPKTVLHTVRSTASSINLHYPLFSLRSSGSCLHLFPRLSVTSTLSSTFPSITCSRKQFLRQMWPIQVPFLHFTVCSTFLSSFALCNTSSFLTRSVQLISIVSTTTFQNFSGISDRRQKFSIRWCHKFTYKESASIVNKFRRYSEQLAARLIESFSD